MEDGQEQKIKQNKNTSPKPQNHRQCFIFEMTIPHIWDEQRVPKCGNVCIESGQLNNKKWDKLKALINAKRTHIKRNKNVDVEQRNRNRERERVGTPSGDIGLTKSHYMKSIYTRKWHFDIVVLWTGRWSLAIIILVRFPPQTESCYFPKIGHWAIKSIFVSIYTKQCWNFWWLLMTIFYRIFFSLDVIVVERSVANASIRIICQILNETIIIIIIIIINKQTHGK